GRRSAKSSRGCQQGNMMIDLQIGAGRSPSWRHRIFTGIACVLGALATLAIPAASRAQTPPGNYPDRSVKIIVPFAPAGPTDVVARLVAPQVSGRLGRQVVIEEHP